MKSIYLILSKIYKILLIILIASPFKAFTQKAELSGTAKNDKELLLTGTLTVNSSDSSYIVEHDGNFYLLLKTGTGIKNKPINTQDLYKVFPNLVRDNLNIVLPANAQGRIEVYDALGKGIAATSVEARGFSIPSQNEEILFLRYISEDGQSITKKILSTGENFTANIRREGEANGSQQKNIQKAGSLLEEDEYSGTATPNDTEEYESVDFGPIHIPLGTHHTENIIHPYTEKEIKANLVGIGKDVYVSFEDASGTTNNDGNLNLSMTERMSRNDSIEKAFDYSGENVVQEYFNQFFKMGENLINTHAQMQFGFTYESNAPGTNFVTTDAQGNTITNGTVERTDSIFFTSIGTLENYVNDTIKGWAKPGNTNILAQMSPIEYERLVTAAFNSSIQGKSIKPGTQAFLKISERDSLFAYTDANGNAIFAYTTFHPNENAKLGTINTPGHQDIEDAIIIDEEIESFDKTLQGEVYEAQVPVQASDADQGAVEGGLATLADSAKYLNMFGNAVFNLGLNTNDYNELITNNFTVMVNRGNASHDFAQVEKAIAISQAGTQDTAKLVAEFINNFYVESNNSTENMLVELFKEGGIVARDTSDANGVFSTPTIQGIMLNYVLDSARFSKPGKVSEVYENITLQDGGNVFDVTLVDKIFERTVAYTLNSSLPGKQILPGTQAFLKVEGADSLFAYSNTSGVVAFAYTTTDSIANAKLGVKEVAGHQGNIEEAIIIDEENEAFNKELQGKTYVGSKDIRVVDADQGEVEGALVEAGDSTKYTNVNGIASFTFPLTTDIYNVLSQTLIDIMVSNYNASHDFANVQANNIEIQEGTNNQQNMIVEFINKFFAYGNNSTKNMNVEGYKNGNKILNAISNNEGEYKTDTITSTSLTMPVDSIVYSKPGKITQVEKNLALQDGGDQIEKTLADSVYTYLINMNLSNGDGKTELSFRGYAIANGDTLVAQNFIGTSGQLSFDTTATSLDELLVGAKNIPNFTGGEISKTGLTPGNTSATIVTNALQYFFTMSGKATHENSDAAEGVVAVAGKAANTDANGDYAINNIEEVRGINNQSITPYDITAIFTGTNDADTAIVSVDGSDKVVNFSVANLAQTHYINGTGHLIGAVLADSTEAIDYLKAGNIRIKFMKDDEEFDIGINADGSFNDSIVGDYSATDSILITYVNNPLASTNTFSILDASKPASTGKLKNDNYEAEVAEAESHGTWTQQDYTDIGETYLASLQAPGFIQHSAETTLDNLTGKNLYFVAMSDSALNNPDAIDMIRNVTNLGIGSYAQDTLIFVNYLTNVSTGEQISLSEQQDQQEAIDLLEQEMTTRTGIPLAYTNKITDTEFGDVTKKAFVYKQNAQATNTQFGDTPTTWSRSYSHTRPTDGIGLIIKELGGGALCIRDLPSTGTNQTGFTSEAGYINGLSWIGDVSNKAAFLFPETYFRKVE